MIKENYANKKISNLYKSRAEKLLKYIPGDLCLDEEEGVWRILTTLQMDGEECLMIAIKYFEEVVGIEVIMQLPDCLNNQVFKHKIEKQEEFEILDNYNARIFIVETIKENISFLVMQIAYVFTENGEYDSYNINKVADILAYIGSDVKCGLQEKINKISELSRL